MATENFYPGTTYPLEDSDYGDIFTGYRVPHSELGGTTSIQTANQIQEVTNLLNQGIKNVEVSTINPEVFEMIPDQHLTEINRLSKLTGSNTSLHAPMIEPSGFTQQGWNETNREAAEKHFTEVVERAHKLNPKGNIPVTIHASAVPGTEYMEIKNKQGDIKEVPRKMVAVNQITGELIPLIREKRYYPGRERIYEAEEEREIANEGYWDNKLSQLAFYKERGDELLTKYYPLFAGEKQENLTPEQKKIKEDTLGNAMIYLKNTHQNLNSLYNQAYQVADNQTQKELKQAGHEFKKIYEQSRTKKGFAPSKYSQALQNLINKMQEVTASSPERKKIPEIYKPIEEFINKKATQTLSNAAYSSYNKFKSSTPIISVENPPYGQAGGTAKDLKKFVDKTRDLFAKKLSKEKGMSSSEAKKTAEKIIGVTWDTSHISMMRKSGFKPERLVKEAETIAPYVKHVHYNDNFGNTHTDLPPGMGNVPFKEVMTALKKGGAKGKKIFEGGNFFQHFKTSPHPYVLESSGSPLFPMKAPYWNQIQSVYGDYFSGYGEILPQTHFSTYGGGFSGMPVELGGQQQGGRQSRMSGTPMQ